MSKLRDDIEEFANILEFRSITKVKIRWKKITIFRDLNEPSTRFSLNVCCF